MVRCFVIICIACKLLSSVMYSRSLSAFFHKSDTENFREDMMIGFSIAFFGGECIRFCIE